MFAKQALMWVWHIRRKHFIFSFVSHLFTAWGFQGCVSNKNPHVIIPKSNTSFKIYETLTNLNMAASSSPNIWNVIPKIMSPEVKKFAQWWHNPGMYVLTTIPIHRFLLTPFNTKPHLGFTWALTMSLIVFRPRKTDTKIIQNCIHAPLMRTFFRPPHISTARGTSKAGNSGSYRKRDEILVAPLSSCCSFKRHELYKKYEIEFQRYYI